MLTILLVLVITASVFAFPPIQERIVNGTIVTKNEYPFMVSIRHNTGHGCGGTILDKNHILTAAHCLWNRKPDFFNIQYGQKRLTQDYNNTAKVVAFRMHKDYTHTIGYYNDIAIMKLDKDIPFGNGVDAVKLPPKNFYLPGYIKVEVAGWGIDKSGGVDQKDLLKAELETLSNWDCTQIYGSEIDEETHICALGAGRAHCSGDSGGPLTFRGIQVGIVSWSHKPCGKYPGVYTKISEFLDWIENNRHF